MFSRLVSLLPIAALATVVAASCNSGKLRCCDQKFDSPATFNPASGDDGLIGVLVGVVADVGITCSPITVVGVASGGQCTVQTACCNENTINGAVNVVCSPINVNL